MAVMCRGPGELRVPGSATDGLCAAALSYMLCCVSRGICKYFQNYAGNSGTHCAVYFLLVLIISQHIQPLDNTRDYLDKTGEKGTGQRISRLWDIM